MKNFIRSTTFLAIVASLLWSTAFAGIKIGLQYHTPLQFAACRFTLAGIMVMVIYRQWGFYWREVRREWRFILTIGFIQVIVQYGLFYTGMNLVPAALGAMIVGSSPLFVALVSHFTHPDDRLTPVKTVSILVGVAGIAIITLGRQQVEMKNPLEWAGILLLILNNMASGYSNVLVSKNPRPVSPIILTSASLFFGGMLLYLVSLPLEGFHGGPFPATYWVALFWLAFLSASAFSIWYTLLKRPGVRVSELNVWKFLIPVSGAALSWMLIKGEKPDLISIAGMLFIVAALLLINRKPVSRRKL
ncbi:MAG: DMT family transporter [Prolixibacteraceae bacterium]|jgi:drug/metabolite transporter (DMT)-like permease|nr:EamA family transporter [Prolixibacteraceae bacterium]MDI9563262.1 DMT family transporter [Bacteroidota bacterium]NLS99344.1 EamA family transporter [Bacteroidales bacterium]OQB81086.1 MAG: putative inner membrane transporter yiJE [Bacteroidetes bacterium ADurb.Bin123]HNZ68602.1 DMT family transporter [Prolixibacteraceae bacterium]